MSDTTAVALAAALGPAICEIYTDVSGVYTADPRVATHARVIPRLGYRVCSTLAHLGSRVLHARCVDLAARHYVPLTVRSSFDELPGTFIGDDDMEGPRIEAIAHRDDVSIAIAEGNAGGRGEARGMIESVADALPELELIAHEQAAGQHHAIVWLGTRADVDALQSRFRELRGPGMEWRLGDDGTGERTATGFIHASDQRQTLQQQFALEGEAVGRGMAFHESDGRTVTVGCRRARRRAGADWSRRRGRCPGCGAY